MNTGQIDKFLFQEMAGAERERLEDEIAASDELFVEVAERENELVDQFLRGELSGEMLSRFERSLETTPSRRQKVANARMLHELMADERKESKAITIAERRGFLERYFSFQPGFQFASVIAVVLLVATSAFLVYEMLRLANIEHALVESQIRESQATTERDSEREASGDLASDLADERERTEQLEAEIARLRQGTPSPTPATSKPTIATLVLPAIAIRGGGPPERRLQLPIGVERVSILISVPADAPPRDSFSVRLNGEVVGSDLRVRTRRGERTVAVTVRASMLKTGRNSIELIDADRSEVSRYVVVVGEEQ